jgi:microcystin-dependent protein
MGQPFVGEIRMFGGNFAPAGWMFCNGQLLPISEYATLFNLIGTTYGGDGQNTFALPNLQGRLPIHQGSGFVIGQLSGEENHTVTTNEIPSHTHSVNAKGQFTSGSPSGNVFAGGGASVYKAGAPTSTMNPGVVKANAGGQPHNNLMPFLAVSFIISLFGIYPSRS